MEDPWHIYNFSTITDTVCQALVPKERNYPELYTRAKKSEKKNHSLLQAKKKNVILANPKGRALGNPKCRTLGHPKCRTKYGFPKRGKTLQVV